MVDLRNNRRSTKLAALAADRRVFELIIPENLHSFCWDGGKGENMLLIEILPVECCSLNVTSVLGAFTTYYESDSADEGQILLSLGVEIPVRKGF